MTIALFAIGLARAGDVANTTRTPIQIPPEELGIALQALGEVEGLQVVFVSEDVANVNTRGASGNLTRDEALNDLLRGTALTYRFLERRTVMILPASIEPAALESAGGSPDRPGLAPTAPAVRLAQVTVTASKLSAAQQFEYFRKLAATPRAEYKRLAPTLPFVDAGSVKFAPAAGPWRRTQLGPFIQSGTVDGVVLSRVFNFSPTRAEQAMAARNTNSFPVFAEIDYENMAFGEGAYVALSPGATGVLWSWRPLDCWLLFRGAGGDGSCRGFDIFPGTARVRILKEWDPREAH